MTDELPSTATTKVIKRVLRSESWHCNEPVWWRPVKGGAPRPLTAEDVAELDRALEERLGRLEVRCRSPHGAASTSGHPQARTCAGRTLKGGSGHASWYSVTLSVNSGRAIDSPGPFCY